MRFPFSWRKIKDDRRIPCLAYLEEEYKLTTFEEREAGLYNNALTKYGNAMLKDERAGKEMSKAGKRLVEAANEILRRRRDMAAIPDEVSAMFLAWSSAFSAYLTWATAQSAAIEAVTSGMKPVAGSVEQLFEQFGVARHKAEDEERKLSRRLEIRGEELQRLYDKASTEIAADKWRPQPSKKSKKSQ